MRSEKEVRERLDKLTKELDELEVKMDPENEIINVYLRNDQLDKLKEIFILQWVLGEKIMDPRPLPGRK